MSEDLEGRIDVRIARGHGRILEVAVRSTRPQVAQRLMVGRTPSEAAELAGLVFSLCGKAQRVAAESACAAAEGAEPDGDRERDRVRRVLAELAQEHTWRVLVDWPQAFPGRPDLAPDRESVVALRRAAGDAESLDTDVFADRLETLLLHWLGEPPDAWLARDLSGIEDWCTAGETLPARLLAAMGDDPDPGATAGPWLPPLERLDGEVLADLAGRALSDPDFCRAPHLSGSPAETGAPARQARRPLLALWMGLRGRGLGARLLARLLELALMPEWLRCGAPPMLRAAPLWAGTGVAAVETSRGLLIHAVRLRNGAIADYRILAPTEWTCHPRGPLSQALLGLDPGPGLAAAAGLVVRSLDPCVAFGIEVCDA